MAFKNNNYATVWTVEPVSDTLTRARISTSRKNRQTGEYETDFSGFVAFVGSANAAKAARLSERDRIRLGDVEVTNRYVKEKNITYTNFTIFSFEMADAPNGAAGGYANASRGGGSENFVNPVDGFAGIDGTSEENLPF